MENKTPIGIAQVLQHLKDGKTRDDIAAHYGITKAECKLLFQHEDLKGKKTIKKPSFVIVADETVDMGVKDAEEVVADAKVEENTVEEDSKEEETVEDTAEAKEDFGTTTSDDVVAEDTKEEAEEEESIETEAVKATWD